ncbi:MAG: hypothetical protein AAF602_06325 [Myxococcota bacterium]
MASMRSALFGVLLTSCATGPDGELEEPVEDVELCAAYTWDTVGHPFVLSWCTGCHGEGVPEGQRAGAPVGVDLDTEALVATFAERIAVRATGTEPDMPPAGGPSDREIEDLEMWLACREE